MTTSYLTQRVSMIIAGGGEKEDDDDDDDDDEGDQCLILSS